jgi:anaerobic magnesium-protoporphyrin IX monomethyl ester cyclase
MTILFFNPPARQPVWESLVVPPLGLAYLAAVLRRAGYPVKIRDAFAERMDWQAVGAYFAAERPEILAVSSMAPTIDLTFKTLRLARPYVKTMIMGGPQVSVWGREIFQQCPELDLAVIGEGEETILELVAALAAGHSPEGIPGVIGRDFHGPTRRLIKNLDLLPFPARELLPLRSYRYPFAKTNRVTTLFTSRGCPYHCSFCDKSVFGSRWRARSSENVLEEITEIVKRFGINSVIIYDDLFTLDHRRVQAICEGILQRGYQLDWKCEGRVDLVDFETLKMMKRAGCSMIAYGVETGNQKGLDYLQKGTKLEQIRQAFSLTHRAGLETMAYFILGIPVESFSDELQTIRFAKEINPTYVQFSTLSPYCGTRLYQEAAGKNWLRETDARNPMDKDLKRPVVMSPLWSPEDLQRIMRQAHLSFYLRPGYLLKRLKTLKSPAQLINASRGLSALGRWLLP